MRYTSRRTGENRQGVDHRTREKKEHAAQKATTPKRQLPIRAQRLEVIANTRPAGLTDDEWRPVHDFVAPLIEAAELPPDVAGRIMRIVGVTAITPLRVGAPLTAQDLFAPAAMTRFIATEGAGMSRAMKQQFRTSAARLGRAIGMPEYPPIDDGVPRTGRDGPYTTTERELYYAAVARIVDPDFRADGQSMLDLSFEAGVTATQGRIVCGTDVKQWGHHVVVRLVDPKGIRPPIERPVRDAVAPRLLARAKAVGAKEMIRPGFADRDDYVETTVKRIRQADPRLPNFLMQRAADAWAIDILERLDLPVLPRVLGLAQSSHTLTDLLAKTDPPTRDRYLNVLNKIIENQ